MFEVESEPEFEDFEDEIENDGIFGIAGNWSGEILVRHYDDEDW